MRAGRADGERGREPGIAGERPGGERAAGHQHQHRGHHQLRRSTALAGFLTIVSTRRRHSAAAHLVSHGVQEGPERGRAALRARARLRRARLRPTARVLTLRCRGGKTVIGNQRPQRRRPRAPTLTLAPHHGARQVAIQEVRRGGRHEHRAARERRVRRAAEPHCGAQTVGARLWPRGRQAARAERACEEHGDGRHARERQHGRQREHLRRRAGLRASTRPHAASS